MRLSGGRRQSAPQADSVGGDARTWRKEIAEPMEGKVAAITGAASGIGLSTAKALLAAGARVVMVDRDEKALARLAQELGENAIQQITDLLDPESCNAMVPRILEKTGQIDILLCNAGSYIGGDLIETNPAAI